ncbi:MAG: redoxin domain-containing protein, partial [Rhodocyclaceae bacterium]|nr:redoxin domain-containing protein [Rhodocyclaceae bacterium]
MRRLLAIFLALLLAACGNEPPARLNIGDTAPAFRTLRPDGASIDFPAAYRGQAVVLRFWADWCKFCEPEMKLIDAVRRRHGERFATRAVNTGQDRATVASFM